MFCFLKKFQTCLFISAVLLSQNWAQTLLRGPYLQIGTPNSMVLKWRTDISASSEVRYGTNMSSLTNIETDATSIKNHEVLLTNLNPFTKYYYAIYSNDKKLLGDKSTYFKTSPDIGVADDYRIWVIGDPGTANDNARSVRDAYLNYTSDVYTNVWLLLGDNAYTSGTDAEHQKAIFENMYESLLKITPAWPTLGNHEGLTANSNDESGPYYDIWTLPTQGQVGGEPSNTEAYYSFDYGNIHFVCLNSNDIDRSPTGKMATWLKADLSKVNSQWLIAFFHHPPYSKGSHNSDSERNLKEMRQNFLPILEQNGTDLTLTGHSHAYERSFFINGQYGFSQDFTDNPDLFLKMPGNGQADGDGSYQKTKDDNIGTVHIVDGSSGKTSGGSLNHPVMYKSLNTLGSVVLDINNTVLKASFLDAQGKVQDYFSIEKEGPVKIFYQRSTLTSQNLAEIYAVKSQGIMINSWITADYKIGITDSKGKEIFTKFSTDNKTHFFPMKDRPSAVYMVKITANDKIQSKKVIWEN